MTGFSLGGRVTARIRIQPWPLRVLVAVESIRILRRASGFQPWIHLASSRALARRHQRPIWGWFHHRESKNEAGSDTRPPPIRIIQTRGSYSASFKGGDTTPS